MRLSRWGAGAGKADILLCNSAGACAGSLKNLQENKGVSLKLSTCCFRCTSGLNRVPKDRSTSYNMRACEMVSLRRAAGLPDGATAWEKDR